MTPEEMRNAARVVRADAQGSRGATESAILRLTTAIWGVGAEVVEALGHEPAQCGAQCGDAVGAILDEMIEDYRGMAKLGDAWAPYYIEALQSAKKNLIGKEKP